jgi:hypothetical protein
MKRRPPPGFSATNAGIEMKLIAEVWVAITDMPLAHHGRRPSAR